MSSLIFVHVGQAGVQIANTLWELLSKQYGLCPDGSVRDPELYASSNHQSIFEEGKNGNHEAKATLIDFEPSVIDEVAKSSTGPLFSPGNLLKSGEDSSDIYTRGYHLLGG